MAKKTIVYKGFHGSIEVDTKEFTLSGRILFIDEDINYRADSFAELENNFQAAVDTLLEDYARKGIEPPFSE